MTEVINYSELAALASCESKHFYAYVEKREEEGPRKALHKGTLLHVGGDRWFNGQGTALPAEWTDDINTGGKPGEQRTLKLADFDPEVVAEAQWLLGRYEEHYGPTPPDSWHILATEEWMTMDLEVMGQLITLVGRSDGVFIDEQGRLWLREIKSYGSKGRLDTVAIEPQLTLYYMLVEATYGEPPFGIMFDGIYTYQWALKKPTQQQLIDEAVATGLELVTHGTHLVIANLNKTQQREWAREAVANHPGVQEHPPADSFRREWPDRTPDQLEIGKQYLAAAVTRRSQITSIEDTIPNIGQACNSCGFKPRCWDRLAGGQELQWDEGELATEPV